MIGGVTRSQTWHEHLPKKRELKRDWIICGKECGSILSGRLVWRKERCVTTQRTAVKQTRRGVAWEQAHFYEFGKIFSPKFSSTKWLKDKPVLRLGGETRHNWNWLSHPAIGIPVTCRAETNQNGFYLNFPHCKPYKILPLFVENIIIPGAYGLHIMFQLQPSTILQIFINLSAFTCQI